MPLLTERGLLHLEDLCDDGLLLWRLCPRLDVPDDERDLHDVMHGRHEKVRQLQLLAPRIPVAPLQGMISIQMPANSREAATIRENKKTSYI